MVKNRAASASHPQRGFSLIEIMIGLVIGLIAVLVIYQVYTVSEGFKRNTTAAGEAQMNGLFSTFVLGMEIANGGAGMAVSSVDLGACADPTTYPATDPRHFAQSFRPIPVMIYDGVGASKPDSFVVNYSIATTLAATAMFNVNTPPDQPYEIQSPGGFHAGDLIIGVVNPSGGDNASGCASSQVISAVPAAPNQRWVSFFGALKPVASVAITHTAVTYTGPNADFTGICTPGQGTAQPDPVTGQPPACPSPTPNSTLFNMGPANRAQKVMYRLCDGRTSCPQPPVCGQSSPCTLESVALLGPNGQPLATNPAGNPLASNIVNMKVEYGIADPLDPLGLLNTWVQADVGGGWDPATLLPALTKQINLIKAIRIGLIVQSEQFDKNLAGFTGGDYVNGDYNWVLFDCAQVNCPGRLTGSVAASSSPPGNWRFRKYETVIPLRNEIWNKQS
jgi:prepilin-type N-terminal cleavage/methylation domain-containing protein